MLSRNFLILFVLPVMALFSCKNEKKVAVESPIEVVKQVKSKSPKVMTEASLDLTKYGIANNRNNVLGGLKVGDIAPDFSLYNQEGNVVNLNQKLNTGPIVLVFYRADWCPYCSKHLIEFKDRIQEIHKKGYANVVAVTPQTREYSAALAKENKLFFPILEDKGHTVMKKYKVFFHVTDDYNDKVKKYHNKSIEEMNGDKEPVLCVPATYVIGQDLKIKYVHYDPDYSQRADVQDVLDHL